MLNRDLIASLFLISLSLAIWTYAATFPEMEEGYPGPALFPRIIALLLFVCGMGLLVGSQLRKEGQEPISFKQLLPGNAAFRLIGGIAIASIFPIVNPYLGLIPTLLIVCMGIALILRANWIKSMIATTVMALCLYGVFKGIFGLPL